MAYLEHEVTVTQTKGRHDNSIRHLGLVCSKCGKKYSPKDELRFHQDEDGNISLWCPACVAELERQWDVVEVIEWAKGNMALCKFADGHEDWYQYAPDAWARKKEMYDGIPENFLKKFYAMYDSHVNDEYNKQIKSFDYVESFDEMRIVVTQNGGKVTEIKYKTGSIGQILLNPEEFAKVDDELRQMITDRIDSDMKKVRAMYVDTAYAKLQERQTEGK
ncbi:MAG: hypothetical protein ACRC76_10045 [Proteocatella sp.]